MRAGRTRQEDLAALADLVDRHYASLFAYLDWLTGDRALAQDLVQECFLRACDAHRLPARPQDARLWLFREATSLAQEVKPGWAAEAVGGRLPTRIALWSRQAEPAGLQLILASLPRGRVALLLLYRHFGFSLAEAAAIMEMPAAASRDLVAQAYAECARPRVPALSEPGHESLWPALARYGDLDPVARRRVDGHLHACVGCATRRAAYTRLEDDLARLPESWPIPRDRTTLAAAIRRDGIGGLRRTGTAPASSPRRRVPLAAGLIVIALLAVWAAVRGLALLPAGEEPGVPAAAFVPAATVVPTALPTPAPQPALPPPGADGPSPAALAWLQQHSFPLTITEPSAWYGDLLPLRPRLNGIHVVVLDDNTGLGSHQAQTFRQRLLEMLVGEYGFDTLTVPLDWASGDLLNQYVQGAPLDPLQVLTTISQNAGTGGGLWLSQETLYTMRWLRNHNAEAGAGPRVAIRGYLPLTGQSGVPLDVILGYLEDVDPGAVDRIGKRFAADHNALLALLQGREAEYVQRSSPALYRRALNAATALVQYDTMASATTTAQRTVLVDALSMLNLMREWSATGPTGKEFMWTPNLTSSGMTNLENLLQAERRGGAILFVGLTFYEGTLYVAGGTGDSAAGRAPTGDAGADATTAGLRSFTLPAAPPGSYEDYLVRGPRPNFYVDLHSAFDPSPDTIWLRQAHLARSGTSSEAACMAAAYDDVRLNRTYDIVVYYAQVSPPSLLLQRPPAAILACPPAS